MNFLDHLEELRGRLIKSSVAVFVCAIPCFIYWHQIFDFLLVYPLRYANPKPSIIYTAPAEAVMLSFKIALVCGLIVAIPFIFYQLWAFVAPGLYGKEKKVVLPVVISSTFSFFCGLTFAYFMLPWMLKVLTTWGGSAMMPYFKANEYISFMLKLSVACGIVFEMPVVSWVLTRMGLLTPQFLVSKLRHATVLIFIVAAVITPPDAMSMMFMALPLMIIYGVSILVSFLTRGREA
ncbi:MAG TPA: twin-arginine translocase subunit TatC [Chitinivibrionales bacterium]|nr:twin-arginine translocase subunit TatC [Chitinivibrionales bacterium]